MELHQLSRNSALLTLEKSREVTHAKGKTIDNPRAFRHPIGDAKEFPQRMPTQVVILLTIGEA
jgi:hypothetical protein